jgi:L-alanine-DL-glutamate epimerase-like enolase superfamily enzyme
MKIDLIEIHPAPIRLKKPFVISLGRMEHASNVLVVIRASDGSEGFGECSPFMTINGETMETACAVGRFLARALIGRDPRDVGGCCAVMDRVIHGNASIKSAFDIALHDLAARHAGLPLYAYLGGKPGKPIHTDLTVSLGTPADMAAAAREIQREGYRHIKVKLGDGGKRDVERIRRIREAVGQEIPLRLDANQGWTVEEAITTLQALAPYGIEHCEEPIPRWAFMELGRVSAASPVPVMADETCCDHHDAERLIALGACPLFNLKLGKSSGLHKALKIVRLAEKAGTGMQVGGFLESRLATTAGVHLALCSDHIRHFDFDAPLFLQEDHVTGGMAYHDHGRITLPEAPGLGAGINRDYLSQLQRISIQ